MWCENFRSISCRRHQWELHTRRSPGLQCIIRRIWCAGIGLDLDVIRYSQYAAFNQELHRERERRRRSFSLFFFPQQQLPIVFVHPQFFLFFSAPIISSAAVFFLSLSRPLLMEEAEQLPFFLPNWRNRRLFRTRPRRMEIINTK